MFCYSLRMQASLHFLDSYWYCYANSTAMLLRSIGERIEPSLIEVLSGVSFGAFISDNGLPFFSGYGGCPDKGISKALNILGFELEERASETGVEAPFALLKEKIEKSPVILGPLDMSYLRYNPKRPKERGVDHYVVAYKIGDKKIFLNDPAGYANVFISFADMEKAWKAEKVSYRRDYFRYWTNPERLASPSVESIYKEAIKHFKDIYENNKKTAEEKGVKFDESAILKLARQAKNGKLNKTQIGQLTHFALPLGAKRALDYASFFKGQNASLTALKIRQAELFGLGQTYASSNKWDELGNILEKLAEIEKKIKQELFK